MILRPNHPDARLINVDSKLFDQSAFIPTEPCPGIKQVAQRIFWQYPPHTTTLHHRSIWYDSIHRIVHRKYLHHTAGIEISSTLIRIVPNPANGTIQKRILNISFDPSTDRPVLHAHRQARGPIGATLFRKNMLAEMSLQMAVPHIPCVFVRIQRVIGNRIAEQCV